MNEESTMTIDAETQVIHFETPRGETVHEVGKRPRKRSNNAKIVWHPATLPTIRTPQRLPNTLLGRKQHTRNAIPTGELDHLLLHPESERER